MGDKAGDRLEGWLEEPPWEDRVEPPQRRERVSEPRDSVDPLDDWPDDDPSIRREPRFRDEDPWV